MLPHLALHGRLPVNWGETKEKDYQCLGTSVYLIVGCVHPGLQRRPVNIPALVADIRLYTRLAQQRPGGNFPVWGAAGSAFQGILGLALDFLLVWPGFLLSCGYIGGFSCLSVGFVVHGARGSAVDPS